MYSQGAANLKNSMDTYTVMKSENCYQDTLGNILYNVHFSYNCDESINSFFIKNCLNCIDCIGCMNLRNKKYCIFNQQYTKEEYEEIKKDLDFGSYKKILEFRDKFKNFVLMYPNRYGNIGRSVNISGDNMINAKNVKQSFDIYGEVEDSKYVAHGLGAKDSYDCYGFGGGAYLLYEGVDTGLKASNVYFWLHRYTKRGVLYFK